MCRRFLLSLLILGLLIGNTFAMEGFAKEDIRKRGETLRQEIEEEPDTDWDDDDDEWGEEEKETEEEKAAREEKIIQETQQEFKEKWIAQCNDITKTIDKDTPTGTMLSKMDVLNEIMDKLKEMNYLYGDEDLSNSLFNAIKQISDNLFTPENLGKSFIVEKADNFFNKITKTQEHYFDGEQKTELTQLIQNTRDKAKSVSAKAPSDREKEQPQQTDIMAGLKEQVLKRRELMTGEEKPKEEKRAEPGKLELGEKYDVLRRMLEGRPAEKPEAPEPEEVMPPEAEVEVAPAPPAPPLPGFEPPPPAPPLPGMEIMPEPEIEVAPPPPAPPLPYQEIIPEQKIEAIVEQEVAQKIVEDIPTEETLYTEALETQQDHEEAHDLTEETHEKTQETTDLAKEAIKETEGTAKEAVTEVYNAAKIAENAAQKTKTLLREKVAEAKRKVAEAKRKAAKAKRKAAKAKQKAREQAIQRAIAVQQKAFEQARRKATAKKAIAARRQAQQRIAARKAAIAKRRAAIKKEAQGKTAAFKEKKKRR